MRETLLSESLIYTMFHLFTPDFNLFTLDFNLFTPGSICLHRTYQFSIHIPCTQGITLSYRGYMIRDMKERLCVGDTKYLVSNAWFVNWQKFVEYDPTTTTVPYSNKHLKHSTKAIKPKHIKQGERGYYMDEYEPYDVAADNEYRKTRGPGPIENRNLCQFDARNKVQVIGKVELGYNVPPREWNKYVLNKFTLHRNAYYISTY